MEAGFEDMEAGVGLGVLASAMATDNPADSAMIAVVPSPTKIGLPTDRETTGSAPPSLRH
jgi:hypothetical protein